METNLHTFWPIIILSYIGLLILGLMDNSRGPYYLNIIQDLDLNDIEGSLLFVMPALTSVLSSYSSVALINRLGDRRSFQVGVFSLAAGFFLISKATNLHFLIFGAGVLGIGIGFVSVILNVMVERNSADKMRAQLYSGLHSNYALASLLAPVLINLSIHWSWDWRQYFQFCAFLAALVALVPIVIPRAQEVQVEKSAKAPASRWPFWVAGTSMALYVLAEVSVSTRLVLFAQRIEGHSLEFANFRLALFFTLLLVGRLFFTFMSLKKGVFKFINFSLIGALLCYTLGLSYSSWGIALAGLFMSAVFPMFLEYQSQIFKECFQFAISMTMIMASLGMVAMHFFIGYVTEVANIKMALYFGPFCLLFSIVLLHYTQKKWGDEVVST